MKRRLDTLLSVVLTMAAVAMAGTVIWRQFFDNSSVISIGAGGPLGEPEFYPGWRAWLAEGVPMDVDSTPVVIIEFTDLECPFCGRFHETVLKKTKETFGAAVTVSFIHFPLRIHRFAEVSAVAAECAGEQGRFAEFVEVVFLKQDSIGLKSWESYALEAKVPRAREFKICVDNQQPLPRVRAGRALADSIGITGTPTVFVNGWRFPSPPKEDELSRVIRDLLAGREPFPTANGGQEADRSRSSEASSAILDNPGKPLLAVGSTNITPLVEGPAGENAAQGTVQRASLRRFHH